MAAAFTNPGDQADSGFPALLLLVVIVLGLTLGLGGIRLRRRREELRLEAAWHQRDADWGKVVRQIETERALFGVTRTRAESSAEPLQKIDAK